ncbi:MAG: hypothetical protein ICV64_11475 [Thermoleophilia bacterium]|nr:hypothetical protein [Thermoleophilia bacterium]
MHALLAASFAALVLTAVAGAASPAYELPPPGGSDPAPAPQPQSATPTGRNVLVATVGPGATVSLRTRAGRRVRTLRAGRYTIAVRDRSEIHNFHLRGPGVNKQTGVAFTGTATWRVRFRKGKTYRYVCDPHASSMRGTFRAR